MSHSVVKECRTLCTNRGSKRYAKRMEQYFKGVLPMHGLKADQIKTIYKEVSVSAKLKEWSLDKMMDTGLELLSSDYFEEKGVGILFLKDRCSELQKQDIIRLSEIMDVHVFDWATCDSLANGVIRHAIVANDSIMELMIDWSQCSNLWRRRASCVAFVGVAKSGKYNDIIETICHNSVQMPERFVQLGVGWVLRELTLADCDRVMEFLKTHTNWMSREGLRYALEKVPNTLRKEMMDYHKEKNKKSK